MKLKNTSNSPDSSNFNGESTNHGNNENGAPGLPLMSKDGERNARAAGNIKNPIGTQIGTSAVDGLVKSERLL